MTQGARTRLPLANHQSFNPFNPPNPGSDNIEVSKFFATKFSWNANHLLSCSLLMRLVIGKDVLQKGIQRCKSKK